MPRQRAALGAASSGSTPWQRVYVRKVLVVDTAVAVTAAGLAYLGRFGQQASPLEARLYPLAMLVLPLVWILALELSRAYEHRFLGVGSEEFRRVMIAGVVVSAFVCTAAFAAKFQLSRGFVLLALPLLGVGAVVSRYALRQQLHRARTRGDCQQRTIVVGHRGQVTDLVATIRAADYHGLQVVGACVPGGERPLAPVAGDVPVVGGFAAVADVVERLDADVVAVLPSRELDGSALRRLGWALEKTHADLLVAPGVVEVIGPRIAIRPVCGLPLLHVERPELDGIRRIAKAASDRTIAALALLVLSPACLVIALAIVTTSRGGPIFRQQRVGRDGRVFTIWKFRTMTRDAEHLIVDLRDTDEGNGVLFKMRSDPRITKVGALLRRYSLDELPQLVNVLTGDMSLVGPRPPLPQEVALYGDDMRRRLLVKPGLTGLWQVSGRSDLSWDESVRIDLRYVENWSFAFDLMIIWKTLGAVVRARGAY